MVGGPVVQVVKCLRVLHPWVSVRRQPTFAVAAAVATHTTSRSLSAHPVDMARLHAFASTAGPRSLTALRLESLLILMRYKRNGYKWLSLRRG